MTKTGHPYLEPHHAASKGGGAASRQSGRLPAIREQHRPTTIETYERLLRLHVRPTLGGLRIQKITAVHLDLLYRRLRVEKNLSPRTVRVIASIVSGSLKYAQAKGTLRANPAVNADVPRITRTEHAVWSSRELRRFLASVENDHLHPLWRVLALTGCRRAEALGLRWLDLDLDLGTLMIQQQVVCVGGELRFHAPKTESGRRLIPIDARTVEVLRRHREAQLLERTVYGEPEVDHDLVFCKPDGSPYRPSAVSQWFQTRRRRAGLPAARLHDLRHSAAIVSLEGEVDAELVRRRLGHSRIQTTVDTYQRHRIEHVERAAADKVANLIDG